MQFTVASVHRYVAEKKTLEPVAGAGGVSSSNRASVGAGSELRVGLGTDHLGGHLVLNPRFVLGRSWHFSNR